MAKNDPVNHPAHYADHYPHEVIELTEHLGFCLGNAVKYILRAPFKGNELEDLKKAHWYITRIACSGNGFASEILINDDDFPTLMELVETFKSDAVTALVGGAIDDCEGGEAAEIDVAMELIEDRIAELEGKKPEKKTEEDNLDDVFEALREMTKNINAAQSTVRIYWSKF